jgi:hypothetical protein
MEKAEQIKLALKIAIEKKFPFSIHEKAIKLVLSDSQVSKILGRQKLPPIIELIRLEKLIGVEIIKVVLPDEGSDKKEKPDFSKLSGRSNPVEKSHSKKTVYDEMKPETAKQLRMVVDGVKTAFTNIISEKKLRFEERITSSYISISLLPESSNIYNTRGIHLLFFRYIRKTNTFRVQFIIPNQFFQNEIMENTVKMGGTETTYLPFRKTGQQYTFQGQPYMDMEGRIIDFKRTVTRLALRVYELQTSSK